MTARVSTVPVRDARAIIARCILGDEPAILRIGDITLHPHQCSAVARVRHMLTTHRGALLCDDVGLGKTYVALATAAAYRSTLIIAPACLVDMWRQALVATRLDAEIVSLESLGRSGQRDLRAALVIVDEAHHFRNPSTRRYTSLATVCARAPVLLLSATPLHNSRDDIAALAALFVGIRAYSMTDAELAHVMVRRDSTGYSMPRVPIVEHAPPRVLIDDEEILDRILLLPPPVPPSDGDVATRLVVHGLARQWISSNAALVAALRRRIGRSHALLSSLDAGRYPTAAELSAWVCSRDSVQLAFAELLDPATIPLASLTTTLRRHVSALEELLAHATRRADDALARFVREVRAAHPRERVVVFSCYAETAQSLYLQMRRFGHAALLTARGGMIASGPVSRNEVIAQFTPRSDLRESDARDQIDLLIATDVLSEGVDLRDASVVVHVDLPWTHARFQQRVGRLARIGSPHQRVVEYTVNPPARAESVMREMDIVARKLGLATAFFGDAPAPVERSGGSDAPVVRAEQARTILEHWRAETPVAAQRGESPCAAFVRSHEPAAVGAWLVDGVPTLLACDAAGMMYACADTVARSLALVTSACDDDTTRDHSSAVDVVRRAAERWYERHRAQLAIGVPGTPATSLSARDPRRVLSRVADRALASSNFSRRADAAALAGRLRSAAATPLPIAVEWRLESLADTDEDAAVNMILGLVETDRASATETSHRGLRFIGIIIGN